VTKQQDIYYNIERENEMQPLQIVNKQYLKIGNISIDITHIIQYTDKEEILRNTFLDVIKTLPFCVDWKCILKQDCLHLLGLYQHNPKCEFYPIRIIIKYLNPQDWVLQFTGLKKSIGEEQTATVRKSMYKHINTQLITLSESFRYR